MHILIVGARGVGKSTLIRRVLEELKRPVWGFETKKEPLPNGPVYIYEAGKPHVQTDENLVGYCVDQHPTTLQAGFDRFAEKLRAPIPEKHIILLDELGFMESASKTFCSAVLALLDGDAPVIAAVKDKNTDFLQAVRSHKNAKCFHITRENRDELFLQVMDFFLP
ncbi:MAG: AAA family ATPase [Ruminococcaceae bacterium]|nr:AAA family ATPase [Oscillospiraceae bacterium]